MLCRGGVRGELCIGGVQVAREYLNRPELSAERFIQVPRLGRVYKTGDVVRWRQDGLLEFLGRNDDQMKIRGYRVELGEVESLMSAVSGVTGAFAQVIDGQLVGWVVGDVPHIGVVNEGMRSAEVLPWMIPVGVCVVEGGSFLLNVNGKVDKKALPKMLIGDEGQHAVKIEPKDDLEEMIHGCFERVSGASGIGIDDEFFAIGGNSLGVMRTASELRGKLDGLRVPV